LLFVHNHHPSYDDLMGGVGGVEAFEALILGTRPPGGNPFRLVQANE
jgi:hypothetical protein